MNTNKFTVEYYLHIFSVVLFDRVPTHLLQ